MDNLDDDVDIDQLNAAMDKAVERRNMEFVTPVGEARERTINTLREVVVAFECEPPGAVADAGAYLVAASVVTLAEKRGTSFWRALDEMLPEADVSSNFAGGSSFAQGSAFGQAAVEQISSQGYVTPVRSMAG